MGMTELPTHTFSAHCWSLTTRGVTPHLLPVLAVALSTLRPICQWWDARVVGTTALRAVVGVPCFWTVPSPVLPRLFLTGAVGQTLGPKCLKNFAPVPGSRERSSTNVVQTCGVGVTPTTWR